MNIGGEKMKVIFLDFDGVINNWNHFNGVDFENAQILKAIINLTNAKVVATTSNKYSLQGGGSIDYYSSIYYNNYVKYLNELGIEIYDITPFVNKDRTLEIKKNLMKHDIKQYVIIDDEVIGEELQDHQVFLDLYKGLQKEHVLPTLKILNGQLGFYPPDYNREETAEELVYRINKYYNQFKK